MRSIVIHEFALEVCGLIELLFLINGLYFGEGKAVSLIRNIFEESSAAFDNSILSSKEFSIY
jgi:hypothetical protein